MSGENKKYEVYFADPRLSMTLPGRLIVRVSGYVAYLVLVATDFTFLISDVPWVRALGIFLILFLIDRLLHLGEPDKHLNELPESGRINLAGYVRPKVFSAIEKAFDRSSISGRNFFLEVIRQFLDFPEIEDGLKRLDVKPDEFRQKIESLLSEGDGESGHLSKKERSEKIEELISRAFLEALDARHRFIESSDVFSVVPLVEDGMVKRIFNTFSIEAGDMGRALILSSVGRGRFINKLPVSLSGFVLGPDMRVRHRIMNRAWTSRPTPTLDRYSTDFTDLARRNEAGFLIGHDAEFKRVIETLARPINPNVLLGGEAGIRKETLIAHLALKLTKDDVPESLFDKRLVSLELQNLVAGAPPEELNARIKNIVEEIILAGNIILYVPDIHNLVKTSGTAYLSAADELMPIIKNNLFPVVGTTYPRELKQYVEARSDFASLFEIVRVNEISEDEAEKIMAYDSLLLEKKFGITISFGAIKKSVKLAKKYFQNKFLPSSAEELLKSAVIDAKRRGEKFLGPDLVIKAAEEKVNVPIHEVTEAEAGKLLNLEEVIHERLIGQDEAVKAVANAVREYRSGLTRRGGPIASFLFVGPTGVGKTELAKILAKIQFGSEKAMIRFDMTEYQDKQSFYRFIGSPDGSTSGALTDAVLQKPYGLVLLDEFEKAFPDILNLFLQVLDDGRLTDNTGRIVDFQNTIIIATSNAHSDIINEALNKGESMADITDYLKRKLVDVFKPELLNRFSKIIVFRNLEPADLEKIVMLNLSDFSSVVGEQGIAMDFEPGAVKKIAKLGYDPAFGARPLRRIIEEKLRSPLAVKLLEKKIQRGSRVKLVTKGDDFDFVVQDN